MNQSKNTKKTEIKPETWHSIMEIQRKGPHEITSVAKVPPDSPWFSGHFPGDPVLPGIAQLNIILQTLSKAEEKRYFIEQLKKVRFKQIIKPDDVMFIIISMKKKSDAYTFKITVRNEIALSGTFIVKALNSK